MNIDKVQPASPPLNTEQQLAVTAMIAFLSPASKDRYFVLHGPAGTGKTFTIRALMESIKSKLIFTAPTNKATKVLRETFRSASNRLEGGYTPDCRTIYSLLGLRMQPDGEIKVLTKPEDPVDLSRFAAVVVDEASMINSDLWNYIEATSREQDVKFIFMGDAAQLPPVKELYSPVWKLPDAHSLRRVMRHDNQILTLATSIRGVVDNPIPTLTFTSDHDAKLEEGILRVGIQEFHSRISDYAARGLFSKVNGVKAISWRNIAVDTLNKLIRSVLYPGQADGDYYPGDRIILLEPAQDFTDEKSKTIAHTDDEGTVERMDIDSHPEYPGFKCYRIVTQMDGGSPTTLWQLHPDSLKEYKKELSRLAGEAKLQGRKWNDYWKFRDSFHNLRYGYAITAHRAQGSTYDRVFVNCSDIMLNRNKQEAFRCFYVAVTRARKEVIIT